ncbi:RNA polymerase sigma factor [Lysinibacillus sp. OL1_EC]|uniref:RNA polymerase sigma factor n=1 Tax=unclassified Lysinibacillus TaxID=2636778 RepID=UPI00103C1B96|nr:MULTISPECIES: RNA polymerase sigma factor [unclassified Lysinibacillus]MCM0623639.1 RNA polymerase sigma factor [Lysinibacillus sp. OL1_EC]TBV89458.1 RNA polymerase sigma factor [Lysinibacillus sp. OL1]WBF56011.1 RNA polymerase sigma factor [Lysinibacillus sp. JK80]
MHDLANLEDRISEIYYNYYSDVYRFLICFSGNKSDAEDMTQEVFIRILKNLPSLNKKSKIKTWIFSIAKHVAVDNYRKKKIISFLTDGVLTKLESADKGPSEIMEQEEIKRIIHSAISNLKPNYRTVVILRGINEFSIKETSEILQCSEAKVKVNYHRALKELKKDLEIFSKKEVFEYAKG